MCDASPAYRIVVADDHPRAWARQLEQADIAFGQPGAELLRQSTRVRWVHLSTAGYTAYDNPEVREHLSRRGVALTTSSSVYAEPCAQHVLAMMLAQSRQLPVSLDHQRTDRAWPNLETRAGCRLLKGQRVLLVAFGGIARRLAELLAPFHLDLVGLRRSVEGSEPIPVLPMSEFQAELAKADHVVNLLPDNASTRILFDCAAFEVVKPGACFYNVGRGTTVDQSALAQALERGQLQAAYLDVTDPEPLPADHPLWRIPNCYITPHSAGGHDDEGERLCRHFLGNLARFEAGAPLLDRVI